MQRCVCFLLVLSALLLAHTHPVNEIIGKLLTIEEFEDLFGGRAQIPNEELKVEIALVCDKEFGDIFNHDMQRILDYWKALFWDVQLRFKTLQRSNISFRITSLTVFQSKEEQPFIEEIRTENGTVSLAEDLHFSFSKWMYTKLDTLSKFDVAMLATAAQVNITNKERGGYAAGLSRLGGICHIIDDQQVVQNSLIVSVAAGSLVSEPALVVAHEIAHMLGAVHDEKGYYILNSDPLGFPRPCPQNQKFIMENSTGQIDHEYSNFFFSRCTDTAIANFLRRSFLARCLTNLDSTEPVLIDTSAASNTYKAFNGLSLNEQCRILQKGPTGYINPKHTCYNRITCLPEEGSNITLENVIVMNPFDGTPCNGNGRCFRGRCLPVGVQLVNVATEECLMSTDHASVGDLPKMRNCPGLATHLDLIIISDFRWPLGKFLKVPLSSPDAEHTYFKCLDLNPETKDGDLKLTFLNCSSNELKGWDFNEIEPGQFLVTHHQRTDVCLRILRNPSKIIASTDCSKNDIETRWKLLTETGAPISNLEDVIEKYPFDDYKLWIMIFAYFLLLLMLIGLCAIGILAYFLLAKLLDKIMPVSGVVSTKEDININKQL